MTKPTDAPERPMSEREAKMRTLYKCLCFGSALLVWTPSIIVACILYGTALTFKRLWDSMP